MRYIFRFHPSQDTHAHCNGCTPEEELTQAIKETEATVIDKASNQMMLVEADASDVAELRQSLPNWIITPERSVPLPDTRKKVNG